MERCEICRFWLAVNNVSENSLGGTGFCRRYPPKKFQEMEATAKRSWENVGEQTYIRYVECFPITTSDEWCGEFKSQ
jgi:hypothetical protein